MTLPPSVPRCPGKPRDLQAGEWPFPRLHEDCLLRCARRRQGIADYMAGAKVLWMTPPTETPCPEMLARKAGRNA